jgi:hypothetical protein
VRWLFLPVESAVDPRIMYLLYMVLLLVNSWVSGNDLRQG